jgi:hypothetical protein
MESMCKGVYVYVYVYVYVCGYLFVRPSRANKMLVSKSYPCCVSHRFSVVESMCVFVYVHVYVYVCMYVYVYVEIFLRPLCTNKMVVSKAGLAPLAFCHRICTRLFTLLPFNQNFFVTQRMCMYMCVNVFVSVRVCKCKGEFKCV